MTRSPEVDAYLAQFEGDARARLDAVRDALHAEVPDAGEAISYGMPTLTLGERRIVHLAGYRRHLSLYPAALGDPDLDRDSAPYLSGAATLKIPHSGPLPLDLIRRHVRRLAAT